MTDLKSKQRFKKIKLTQGKYALVDAEDFEWLSQWKWQYLKSKTSKYGYAVRTPTLIDIDSGRTSQIRMHRVLMSLVHDKKSIDHINGNGLDNRKSNLRIASSQTQAWNKGPSKVSITGIKGVFKNNLKSGRSSFTAAIGFNGKRIYLGTFKSEIAAHRAYIKAAKKYHGEFARWK